MEEGKKQKSKPNGLSASFVTGAISLVFLIIGYQVALFIHKAALTRIAANRDKPDTVYVVDEALARRLLADGMPDSLGRDGNYSQHPGGHGNVMAGPDRPSPVVVRRSADHSPAVREVREKLPRRPVENFRFNPNTVSIEDLQRLGFSEKQAQSIDNYRQKGGRFRRPADFAKSYVVADSVYDRLAPFIDIPRIDINKADSTELLALPGIGPYFAGKVVSYRNQLGGYSCTEQLMEIYHFDKEKFEGLSDLITCSKPSPYPLWTLPEDALAKHPHISRSEAHGIVLYRQHNQPGNCTVEALRKAGVLSEEHAARLALCLLASAE